VPGKERIVLDGTKERQGDFVFTANEIGEYRFCFDNSISTFADKLIDFEISVENEPRIANIPTRQGSTPEQTSVLEESVVKISGLLSSVSRQQKYFRTRENRNFSTVRSTEARIWNFSLMESGLMVGMAALQVFVVRMFFTGGRKGEFSAYDGFWTRKEMLIRYRLCVNESRGEGGARLQGSRAGVVYQRISWFNVPIWLIAFVLFVKPPSTQRC